MKFGRAPTTLQISTSSLSRCRMKRCAIAGGRIASRRRPACGPIIRRSAEPASALEPLRQARDVARRDDEAGARPRTIVGASPSATSTIGIPAPIAS